MSYRKLGANPTWGLVLPTWIPWKPPMQISYIGEEEEEKEGEGEGTRRKS
jgi:hypothetical protein